MYRIIGMYRGSKEELDTAETESEAHYLCNEYIMAFSRDWRIWIERGEM